MKQIKNYKEVEVRVDELIDEELVWLNRFILDLLKTLKHEGQENELLELRDVVKTEIKNRGLKIKDFKI